MTIAERAKLIENLTKSLAESVEKYQAATENAEYPLKPRVGYRSNGVLITQYESAESIKNRIKLIRSELMQLSYGFN